jgi:hypothetical protein
VTEVMYPHVSTVSGYGRVRHHRVSLPRIYELLADPDSRYLLPRDETGASRADADQNAPAIDAMIQ